MTRLEPAVDAYGSRAQRSAIADFVELSAVAGARVNERLLSDYIDGADWTLYSDERYYEPAVAPLDRSTRPDEAARSVFALIEERLAVLGQDRYPFRLERRRVGYTGAGTWSAYAALLAVTVAHAYAVATPVAPEVMFPRMVTLALRELGLNSQCLTDARVGGTFEEAVTSCGRALRLEPTPGAGLRSVSANDAGVDVLAAVGAWADNRVGAWSFIGQATVGSSDSWRRKALDPAPTSWRLYLNTYLPPQPFLAVPHHVEPAHFAWLTQETDVLIVDRLRIAAFGPPVMPEESALCEAVFGIELSPLY